VPNKTLLGALAVIAIGGWLAGTPQTASASEMTVWKTPWCGCCAAWVEHVRQYGIDVTVREVENITPIKQMAGVTLEHQSCHTAKIAGYTIEGHVPAADIARLLDERPEAKGLSVPGMPLGSPGMEMGNTKQRYEVILFGGASGNEVFAVHK